MRRASLTGLGLACVIALLAGSCAIVPPRTHRVIVVETKGPPPHAPAHGYRHHHRGGPELVYDSGLQVYVVVGRPDHYYLDGRYYRLAGSVWECSGDFDRGWKKTANSSLPPGLKQKCTGATAKNEERGRAGNRK